jgi:ABC-type amino acid transport substrate-binding protein
MSSRMNLTIICLTWLLIGCFAISAFADLQEVKQRGVLRHLGMPYANFITGSGDGLDVELMKLFAQDLGVQYEFAESSWPKVIGDLTGKTVEPNGNEIEIVGEVPIRGDVISNGFTVLPWREKIVDFSTPTFPTQVWLVARADSPLKPIKNSGNLDKDIVAVKALVKGRSLLGKAGTCLEPSLYGMSESGAKVSLFAGGLNDLAPAILKKDSELTLLDVPDALVALEKWPGKLKVIGPLSPWQDMATAFPKNSPKLREAFNQFLEKCKKDGTYLRLVKKYYPAVFVYHPGFFNQQQAQK